MKRITITVLAALLLAGCQSAQEAKAHDDAIHAYEQKMTPEWLKANIVVGKTTTDQIRSWLGPARSRATTAGNVFMPDEIWTYTVIFSDRTDSLFNGPSYYRRTKTVIISFKNGTVMNYSTAGYDPVP